jgi:hypothetical protein
LTVVEAVGFRKFLIGEWVSA